MPILFIIHTLTCDNPFNTYDYHCLVLEVTHHLSLSIFSAYYEDFHGNPTHLPRQQDKWELSSTLFTEVLSFGLYQKKLSHLTHEETRVAAVYIL